MKLFVDIEDALNVVVPGREVGERAPRVAECFGIDDEGGGGREVFRVDAKALCGVVGLRELVARLRLVFLCENEDEVTVERPGGLDGDLDTLGAASRGQAKKQENLKTLEHEYLDPILM